MKEKLNGFTLVEMAVVLVIIGLLMAAAMGVGNAQMQASRISSTKQKQEAIKLALINFITRNNRLPCPAIPTLAPGAVGYGVEAVTPGTCTGTGTTAIVSGIVPFSSLGITDENASDGYYNRFTYMVSKSETGLNENTISGLRGAISVHNASPVSDTNKTITCALPLPSTYDPCSSVAVVISHGINGLGAYNSQGERLPLPVGDELPNATSGNAVVMKDFATNTVNPFDDIVMPLTASDLLTPLIIHGTLQDYRSQLSESLKEIVSAVISDAILHRGASCEFLLPPSLPPMPSSIIKDPWNVDITYSRSIPEVTNGSSSGDEAFTLTYTEYGTPKTSSIYVSQLRDAFNKAGC